MEHPISVVLFEDNKNVRDLIEDYFTQHPDTLFLRAAYADADKAVKQVAEAKPDVVLMDIEMPGTSGLDALKKIKKIYPETKILIQTRFEDNHPIFVALCRGASGYILKGDMMSKLEQAILEVHQGAGYLSPTIIAKVIQLFQNKEFKENPDYVALTPRELEALRLMGQGKSYKQIADAMGISYYGAQAHIRNIYEKLHVNCMTEAILKAIELKLIP